MKVAVCASGRDLDTMIDLRFGRCGYFIIVETDDMSFDVFDNENIALSGDAGIQSAKFIASKEVKVVITANVGSNAAQTLSAAGVQLITGQKTGTVREAIEDYKEGKLKITDEISGSGKSSIGRRGMGRGRGR